MISLIYVSTAATRFSVEDLKALLTRSRDNNAQVAITGMLLYKDSGFMQLLEGEEDAVVPLFAKIERDPRHHGVVELIRLKIERREFPSWSMGFKNLHDADLHGTPGYSTFMNEALKSSYFLSDPSRAQKLLATFRQKM